MKRTKTILITAPYFPPHSGGLERYAAELACRLARDKGWQVAVLTTEEKERQLTVEQKKGVTIYRLPYSIRVSNTPFAFSWLFSVRRIIKQIDPDVINIHTPVPGLGDLAALFAGKRPVFVTYHTGTMKKGLFIPDLLVWLYEHGPLLFLLHRARHIFCSSDAVRYDFLGQYAAKSSTVTPGVDLEAFSVDETKKAAVPTVLFVGALGRAEQYKGVWTLIDAIKRVREVVPNVQLTIVGEGDMIPEYQEYVAKQGLKEAVTFTGKLLGEALSDKYHSAHLFTLPSSNDSSPMVITEAMASGLPVVSTTVGGIPTLVREGVTGFLVPPHDAETLADRMVKLLTDPELSSQMSKAAQHKAEHLFSWEGRVDRYNEQFAEVLTRPLPTIVQINAYYPPHLGGVEQVVETVAHRLAAAGRTVQVLTANTTFKSTTEHKPNLTIKRLAAFELFGIPIAPSLLFNLLRIPKQSIMHCHLTQSFWPEHVLLAAKLRRIPYVAHFHLDIEPSTAVGFLFAIYKKLFWGPFLRGATKVVACSSDQVAILVDKYKVRPDGIQVIENAVEDDFFSKREYRRSSDKFRLLYVGRLASQKRVERLVETMSHLTIPAYLTIVGDGNLRQELQEMVTQKQLTNITFAGNKPREEIKQYYQTHDAFVISSEKEGLPLVVLEAMANGLPIIGTNVIGIRGVVNGTGVLVDEPYVEQFVAELTKLWNTPGRLEALSAQSTEKARQYTWEAFMEKLAGLYKTIEI